MLDGRRCQQGNKPSTVQSTQRCKTATASITCLIWNCGGLKTLRMNSLHGLMAKLMMWFSCRKHGIRNHGVHDERLALHLFRWWRELEEDAGWCHDAAEGCVFRKTTFSIRQGIAGEGILSRRMD